MIGWREHRFGDLVRFRNGRSTKGTEPGNFPVFGSNGVIGGVRNPLYHNAIILGRVGAYCGSVMVSTGGFWATDNTIVVEPLQERLDLRYGYYLFTNAKLNRYAGGSAQPLITQTNLRDIPFIVPCLDEQRRIAAILGAYDDLIEVNRRRMARLEAIARGLFEEWFLHLRFPGHGTGYSKSSLDNSLPVEWEKSPLASTCSFVRGRSYRSIDLADEAGMPFVNLKCLARDGGFREDGLKRYTGPYKESQLIRRGDIVMGVTDMTQERRLVGRVARLPLLREPVGVISMDLVKVVPSAGIDQIYLYHWLRFSDFGPRAAAFANGANVLHLSPAALADFPVIVPSSTLQARFAAAVNPIVQQQEVIAASESSLAASRDLLLPRLLSGQLSVSAAESELVAAA